MKRFTIFVLVVAVSVAAAAGAASAHPGKAKPIVVTFEKTIYDPDNLVFRGTTGGAVKGALESRMVPGSLTIDGPIWTFTFDWIVKAKARHKSFVARTTGTFDTTTGKVVMDGRVIRGWHRGACVHEEGQQLFDADKLSFAGEIQISPACRH